MPRSSTFVRVLVISQATPPIQRRRLHVRRAVDRLPAGIVDPLDEVSSAAAGRYSAKMVYAVVICWSVVSKAPR